MTGKSTDGTDRSEEVEWNFAVDHVETFETRHEAVGEAALINRERDDRRRDVTVWRFAECNCDAAVVTLGDGEFCARCGAVIA